MKTSNPTAPNPTTVGERTDDGAEHMRQRALRRSDIGIPEFYTANPNFLPDEARRHGNMQPSEEWTGLETFQMEENRRNSVFS